MAVDDGDVKNEPSSICNFKSLCQSKSLNPSNENNTIVGMVWMRSLGNLQNKLLNIR